MKSFLKFKLSFLILFFIPFFVVGQSPPPLGVAEDFAMYSSSGAVTNVGLSNIIGNVGSNSGGVTGFGNINGQIQDQSNAAMVSALNTAYINIGAQTPTDLLTINLGGQTLIAGVFNVPAASNLTGVLVLDGKNNPNSYFIFQLHGALTAVSGSKIRLINGAQACNIFWRIEGAADITTLSQIKGTLISDGAIVISSGAVIEGRVLTIVGAITITSATVHIPVGCGGSVLTGPSPAIMDTTALYALFTADGNITNTSITNIIGDVGSNFGTVSGFDPSLVNGTIHYTPDASTTQAVMELGSILTYLHTLPYDVLIIAPASFGNSIILTPQVYRMSAATTLTDTVFFDAQGFPDAVFVIQIEGAFSTAANSNIVLLNGAQSCNIFWKVDGAVNLNTNSTFRGTVIANVGAINIASGVFLDGRALTTSGEIFTDNADVEISSCQEPHYFRSFSSGDWSTTSNWESSPDSIVWTSATFLPDFNSLGIRIQTGHIISLSANTKIDQTIIEADATLNRTSGILSLNTGVGVDLMIKGIYQHNGSVNKPEGFGTIELTKGGMIEILEASYQSDAYANDEDGFETRIIWNDSSVFYWHTGTNPSSAGIEYFPGQIEANIPIFRVGSSISMGGGVGENTIFNALVSIDAGTVFTLENAGAKLIRNGIVGSGNLIQSGTSGSVEITGIAELGGTGIISLNSVNGMQISSTSFTILISDKRFESSGNVLTTSGTLDANEYQLTGTATFKLEGVFLTSLEAGFNGSAQTAIHSDMTLEDNQEGSTVILNRNGNQTLTPAQYHHVRYTGNGTLTLSSLDTIRATGDFNPGTGVLVSTGSTVELNGTTSQILTDAIIFNNLIINNSSVPSTDAVTIVAGQGHLQQIIGTLRPMEGRLNTNGNLRLISTETQTASILKQYTPTAEVSGNVEVQRYIGALGGNRLLAAPVSGETAMAWYQLSRVSDIYWYDEPVLGSRNIGWRQAGGNEPLIPGRGYFGSFGLGATTFTLTGPVNTGTVNFTDVSWTVDPLNRVASGWCLIANPYPCTIDWNASSGWSKTNVSTTIFFQDPVSGLNASYNNGVGTLGASRYIASGQAIWIKAYGSSPILSCTEDVKTENQTNFFKPEENQDSLIRIVMKSGNITDDIVMRFHPDASSEFNSELEVELPPLLAQTKFPHIAFLKSNSEYSIITQKPLSLQNGFMMPLYYNSAVGQNAIFTVIANPEISDRLRILNKNTGLLSEINTGLTINESGTQHQNLYLILLPESNDMNVSANLKSYPNPGNGIITLIFPRELELENQIITCTWTDIQGKEVYTEQVSVQNNLAFLVSESVPTGVYTLNISSTKGTFYYRQIITE